MNQRPVVEGLLRDLAPQALVVVARRQRSFADCEDAVQEALARAATVWPDAGIPDRPLGWLIRVASRQLVSHHRSDTARSRREALAASWAISPPDPGPGDDDTLTLLFMCCHEDLTPAAAIPLTLRAVGGLTTREIAAAFLVKEATMAQRISRAKATLKASPQPFALPAPEDWDRRLRIVLHVIYLIFNEGYTSSGGPSLDRPDLAAEAVRLARLARHARPQDPEVLGLLALMLLIEARRPARTGPNGELIPLAEQDRNQWDRAAVREGIELATAAIRQQRLGEYQLQAAIAAVHAQAPNHQETDWDNLLRLYGVLEQVSTNPVITLNRAVAAAMADGPQAGLEVVATVADALADNHRLYAVRAQLLEQAGQPDEALADYNQAIQLVTNLRERTYLQTRAAALSSPR